MSTTVPMTAASDDGQPIPFALTPAAELLAAVAASSDPAAAGRVVEAIRQARPDALPAGHVPTAHALQRTPCFSWCAEPAGFGEPTAHDSAEVAVEIPGDAEGGDGSSRLSALLHTDDNYRDPTPQVHVSHGDDFAVLSASQTEDFADRLITFASQLRRLARLAGEVRPEFCRVFTWCQYTGEHDTHTSRTVALPAGGRYGTYLGASLMAEESEGNDVTASFEADNWLELDAAGLRAEAAKVRAHCGELERLAELLACEESNHRLGLNGGDR